MIKNFAINARLDYVGDEAETIKLLAQNGVGEVFLWWGSKDLEKNIQKVKNCNDAKIKIQTAHLDYKKINNIWKRCLCGHFLVKDYIKQIKLLAKYNIPVAILHVSCGKTPPKYNKTGLNRFRKIVAAAEKAGVVVALENTRFNDYLAYVYDNIKSPNLKICYDCGHDHAFVKDTFDFDKYKGDIVALHIHDNDGTKDQHKLPFDGDIDYKTVLTKIKKSGYKGPITFETHINREYYPKTTEQEFIQEAIDRFNKLNEIYKKIK